MTDEYERTFPIKQDTISSNFSRNATDVKILKTYSFGNTTQIFGLMKTPTSVVSLIKEQNGTPFVITLTPIDSSTKISIVTPDLPKERETNKVIETLLYYCATT